MKNRVITAILGVVFILSACGPTIILNGGNSTSAVSSLSSASVVSSVSNTSSAVSSIPATSSTASVSSSVSNTVSSVASSVSSTASSASAITTNGLVGEWLFSGNANDTSGNGNNGTMSGATLTNDRFGNAGKAYWFNGSSSKIDVTAINTILPNTSGSYSISVWIKLSTTNLVNVAFLTTYTGTPGIGDTGGFPFHLAFELNKLYFYAASTGTHATYEVRDATYSPSNWQLVSYVVDKSSLKISAFLNDSLLTNISSIANETYIDSDVLRVGYMINYGYYFNGFIDDVRIYNRALSAGEISNLYHEGGW